MIAAMFHRPEAEDESIRDLRRAILANVPTSDTPRKATTPTEQRRRSELLDPDIGRLRDVAQPGGFRRQHVRQQGTEGARKSYVHSSLVQLLQSDSLVQLLQPELRSFLEPDPDDDDPDGVKKDAAQDPHAIGDGTSSNMATGIIIAKCCFGSAFLIVPHGYKSAGIIGAPGTLIAVYIFLLYGMIKLIDCRKAWGTPARYGDLGVALGRWGTDYIKFANCLLTFGFNCIWCVTTQKNLSMLFTGLSGTSRLWLPFPFVAALSLVRRLRVFTITNLVGIVLCVATAVVLSCYAVAELVVSGAKETVLINTETPGDILLWIGTCGYIFELICQVLPIYEAAEDKEAMPKLLIGITAAILTLYIAFGLLFYNAFGTETADLATLNLPQGAAAGVIFPTLFSVVGSVTMPLNAFTIFQTYELQYKWSENYLVRKWKKNIVRILVIFVTFFVTWLGGDQLQNFLALVGGLLGCNLAFCVPTALHLAICKPGGLAKAMDIVTFVVGLAIMVVSTYQSLATWK